MTEAKRIEWVDTAKGLGILFVIFAHINHGPIGGWLYSFHIPLFFILSGVVFNHDCDFKTFLKKKVRTLLVPYFCLGAVIAVSQICKNLISGSFSIHSSLVIGVELLQQIRYWVLWFIACLFFVELLFFFILKLRSELAWATTVVLAVLGIVYAEIGGPFLPWNIDACLPAGLFFFAGTQIKKYCGKLEAVLENKKNSVLCFAVCMLVNVALYLLNLSISGEPLEMYMSDYGFAPLTLLAALSGSLGIIICSGWIHSAIIGYIGSNSLIYFALHQQIFIPLYKGLCGLFNIYASGFVAALIGTVLIVSVISLLNKLILQSKFSFILGKKKNA